MSAVSTDGCSEMTCPHHGAGNKRKYNEARPRQERLLYALDATYGIRCNGLDCIEMAIVGESVKWQTGNTPGVSAYYWCGKHLPRDVAPA